MLLRAGQTSLERIGFTSQRGVSNKAIILVATTGQNISEAKSIITHGADALLLNEDAVAKDCDITETSSIAATVPVGVDWSTNARDAGLWNSLDFAIAPLRSAPATAISADGPGMFVSVDSRYSPILVRSANYLPIRGWLIRYPYDETDHTFTIEDILRYKSIVDASAVPVMAEVSGVCRPDIVTLFQQAGISGIVLRDDMKPANGIERVAEFAKAVGALPLRTRRPANTLAATLPQINVYRGLDEDEE
jgi:hypothetical protein